MKEKEKEKEKEKGKEMEMEKEKEKETEKANDKEKFLPRDLCGVSRDFCDWMIERLKWQQKQERPDEPYWEMVG